MLLVVLDSLWEFLLLIVTVYWSIHGSDVFQLIINVLSVIGVTVTLSIASDGVSNYNK